MVELEGPGILTPTTGGEVLSARWLPRVLLSQFRRVWLDVTCDVGRAFYLLVQGFFQTYRYFVGGRDIQDRVDEDVQIEKNFSANCAGPQFVPLAYGGISVDNLFDVFDGILIYRTFGQLTHTIADYFDADPDNHQTYGDGGDLIAVIEAELQQYEPDDDGYRTQRIAAMVPGVGIKCGALRSNRNFSCGPVEPFFGRN